MTYFEFPICSEEGSGTINRAVKIYTSMSPIVQGNFIPNSNNYYLYLTRISGTKHVFASREERDTTNSVPISPNRDDGRYNEINAVIGVENINDLSGILETINVVKFKTIKGTYKVKEAINKIAGHLDYAAASYFSPLTLFYYGFPCYFTVNGNLCSSITFKYSGEYYDYSRTTYYIKDGYYYFENSNVANQLKYGDILNFGSGIEIPTTIYDWIMTNTDFVYVKK